MDDTILVVTLMLTLFIIIGAVGNSMVLYIYFHKKDKSTAGIFIMSLAATDLFTCLFVIPFTVVMVYLQYVVRYDIACKIYMFCITCNVPFAAFIMVAIAIDRYFCICHPFLHVLNIQRAKVIVFLLLTVASTFGIITATAFGVYDVVPKVQLNTSCEGQNCSQLNLTLTNIHCNTSSVYGTGNAGANCTTFEYRSLMTDYELVYNGLCKTNSVHLGPEFITVYQKAYASTYLLSFVIVLILYGLIYKSIYRYRVKKNRRRNFINYPSFVSYVICLINKKARCFFFKYY